MVLQSLQQNSYIGIRASPWRSDGAIIMGNYKKQCVGLSTAAANDRRES
jgi:hypothetical protein